MKKRDLFILMAAVVFHSSAEAFFLPGTSIEYPFPDKAGTSTTTAIHKDSNLFVGWADGYTEVIYGTDVDSTWKTQGKALGKAAGTSDDIVCLGNGGQITMTFSQSITNGPGVDFAVFENAFSDEFLELAWIEVSSDGIHFVRFPNFYAGTNPVGAFGGHDTKYIYGLAGKYRQAYGTPFDLEELQETYDSLIDPPEDTVYTNQTYRTAFTNNFPHLDLNEISYVRLIDIVGDGAAKDSSGKTIYDPHPTTGSGGFDLDAVGAFYLKPDPVLFAEWAATQGLSGVTSADYDNDGRSDLEEYFTGTDPKNPSDLASLSAQTTSNSFQISFNRNLDAQGTIAVESSGSLTPPLWTSVVPTSETNDGSTLTLTLPINDPKAFYRLRFTGDSE
jgi:hypothetical protein